MMLGVLGRSRVEVQDNRASTRGERQDLMAVRELWRSPSYLSAGVWNCDGQLLLERVHPVLCAS
jgi:hypothetical protein